MRKLISSIFLLSVVSLSLNATNVFLVNQTTKADRVNVLVEYANGAAFRVLDPREGAQSDASLGTNPPLRVGISYGESMEFVYSDLSGIEADGDVTITIFDDFIYKVTNN